MKSTGGVEPVMGNGKTIPPPIFFVHVYFDQKGRKYLEATVFFQFYSANKWTTPRGKKIRNWKAAANAWIWSNIQQEKAHKKRFKII